MKLHLFTSDNYKTSVLFIREVDATFFAPSECTLFFFFFLLRWPHASLQAPEKSQLAHLTAPEQFEIIGKNIIVDL